MKHEIIFIILLSHQATAQNKFAKLETELNGKLGVIFVNTANQKQLEYRSHERFPMCSTAKLMVVAAILKKNGISQLNKKITYTQKDLVNYSPACNTKHGLSHGLSIKKLSQATMTLSDNTAMNLLLKELGGINQVNKFARTIGDQDFRLDRQEPALNSAIPGDLRDTSTPRAMAKNLHSLVLGKALPKKQRQLLKKWLQESKTGARRARAAVPKNWIVGSKTGTCNGNFSEIGIIWPVQEKPIIFAIYFTHKKDIKMHKDVIARVTSLALNSKNLQIHHNISS